MAMAKGEWLYFLGIVGDELYNPEVLANIYKDPIPSELKSSREKNKETWVLLIFQSTARKDVIFDNLNHQSIICRKAILLKSSFRAAIQGL